MISIWLTLLATLSFLGAGLIWMAKNTDQEAAKAGRRVKERANQPMSLENKAFILRTIKTNAPGGRRKYLEACRQIAAETRKPDVLDS